MSATRPVCARCEAEPALADVSDTTLTEPIGQQCLDRLSEDAEERRQAALIRELGEHAGWWAA